MSLILAVPHSANSKSGFSIKCSNGRNAYWPLIVPQLTCQHGDTIHMGNNAVRFSIGKTSPGCNFQDLG